MRRNTWITNAHLYGKNTSREAAIGDRGAWSPYSTVQEQLKRPDLVISFIRASYGFFRLGRWPERTWQARTSQITRVEIRLVISAAS